jgi:hypothetical protein
MSLVMIFFGGLVFLFSLFFGFFHVCRFVPFFFLFCFRFSFLVALLVFFFSFSCISSVISFFQAFFSFSTFFRFFVYWQYCNDTLADSTSVHSPTRMLTSEDTKQGC